jgi:hypothetical protein
VKKSKSHISLSSLKSDASNSAKKFPAYKNPLLNKRGPGASTSIPSTTLNGVGIDETSSDDDDESSSDSDEESINRGLKAAAVKTPSQSHIQQTSSHSKAAKGFSSLMKSMFSYDPKFLDEDDR